MKKLLCLTLSVIMLFAIAGCKDKTEGSSGSSDATGEPTYEYVSLFGDPSFQKGFNVRGMGTPIYGDEVEKFGNAFGYNGYFNYGQGDGVVPDWEIHQWATRYAFHDINNTTDPFCYRYTDQGNGKYLYENRSKTVGVDTVNRELRLGLKASECYKYDRVYGQEWPHLLIAQEIKTAAAKPSDAITVSKAQSIKVEFDVKLNSFEDKMYGEANPDIHSAVCMFYAYISYKPEGGMGFSDMIWLGITVFDNRTAYPSGMSCIDEGTKESATGKWIYNIPGTQVYGADNNLYDLDGNMLYDTWATVDVELIPYIQTALADAQRGGCMKGATMDDLYINGMYIGFELPGTYDLDMTFRNLDVKSLIEV